MRDIFHALKVYKLLDMCDATICEVYVRNICTRYQSGQHKVSAFVYAENKLFVKKFSFFFFALIFCWTLFPNKKFALENKAVIFVPKRLCIS